MDQYVAYHSVEKTGHDYEPDDHFRFHSRKPESLLRGAIGAQVWVVVGDGSTGPKRFRLAGFYIPNELERDDENDAWLISGPGTSLRPAPDISALPWFQILRREQNNFSLGFNRIRNAAVVSELQALMPQPSNPSSVVPADENDSRDSEELRTVAAQEGRLRECRVWHRHRESSLRFAKIEQVRRGHPTGRVLCQVPGCGFDFEAVYGDIGRGFAEVHHTVPLAELEPDSVTTLEDLVVVCSNCHRMIHRGGECRAVASLLSHSTGEVTLE